MAEENKKTAKMNEKAEDKKPAEAPLENNKNAAAEKKEEKEDKKKKSEAIAKGKELHMSTKQSVAICNFIRKKSIEKSISMLENVLMKKMYVPMKGEIPHRKGKGKIKSGRYPMQASKIFISLLKSLAANASVNGLENPIIAVAKPDIASRPYRRFGSRRFKRTNILLIARELNLEKNAEKLGK